MRREGAFFAHPDIALRDGFQPQRIRDVAVRRGARAEKPFGALAREIRGLVFLAAESELHDLPADHRTDQTEHDDHKNRNRESVAMALDKIAEAAPTAACGIFRSHSFPPKLDEKSEELRAPQAGKSKMARTAAEYYTVITRLISAKLEAVAQECTLPYLGMSFASVEAQLVLRVT